MTRVLKQLQRRLHMTFLGRFATTDMSLTEKVVKRIRTEEEATSPLSEVEARLAAAELPYDDQCEVAVVLYFVRDLIAEAYRGGLAGGIFSTSEVDSELGRRNAPLACKCVLSGDGHLNDRFRDVLVSVLDGRDVGELADVDCGKIAARYCEWLELPLDSAWRTLAYNSRSSC